MDKPVIILMRIIPASMGSTSYQECVDDNDSIIIDISEKDIERIVSSSDKSVDKRHKILHIVDNIMPESIKDVDTFSLIGIVIMDTIKESSKVLKVLSRAFAQTGDKDLRYDLRHVRLFCTSVIGPYKELNTVLTEQYGDTLYCKPADNY